MKLFSSVKYIHHVKFVVHTQSAAKPTLHFISCVQSTSTTIDSKSRIFSTSNPSFILYTFTLHEKDQERDKSQQTYSNLEQYVVDSIITLHTFQF